jgi:3-hydroxybutyryl-CoA dehydrogenase
MGPFELADYIGLDTLLSILNVLYDGFKDSKYRPCPLLQEYVDAGWLGRKSGRGFYRYSGPGGSIERNGAAAGAFH